jgi:hypothetical protein
MKTSSTTAKFRRISLLALAACALAVPAWAAKPNCAEGNSVSRKGNVGVLDVVGLTSDGRLVCFKDRSANKSDEIGTITGLQGTDTALIGIDFRVQDGLLYGVGNGGGVYTLDTTTAAATLVSQLTEPLTPGTLFGVDFNPAADRLRIVSDAGLSLRHNVNAGGVTIKEQSDLNYAVGVTANGVSGAAYVNNDLDPNTGTTLFDIDADGAPEVDQVVIQSPPNNGSLVATGKLGVDAEASVGFDIFSAPVGGTTVSNLGYAAISVGGAAGFYRINLLTGAASLVDLFDEPVVDIALPLATSSM